MTAFPPGFGALLIVCGMTMGSLSPSSGYWMMVGIGAQLLDTNVKLFLIAPLRPV